VTVDNKTPSCTEQVQKITKADLPLSCPTDHMVLWNAHPKVYLPIEETGQETCPYCGTCFELIDN
tara:strand:- start:765 stop:959 length:195 start_codon:yes stop_codon:yes gene_type:complete